MSRLSASNGVEQQSNGLAAFSQSTMEQDETPSVQNYSFNPSSSSRNHSAESAGRASTSEGQPSTKQESGKRSLWGKMTDRLPDYLARGLVDSRTWKTFARCMAAMFGAMVLMLVQTSLQVIGSATFFGALLSQVFPPSLPFSIYFVASLTLIFGMCLGWAWGCAAMAAGLAARNQIISAAEIQTAQAGFNPNANPDIQYTQTVFHGDYLEPATSAVYGVFLFFGAYAFGFLRASKPRLAGVAIFGSIILDIMVSYGPLYPTAEYTLARLLLVPAGCYLAIAIASLVLIFPQSLHSVVLGKTIKTCFKPSLAQLRLQDDILSAKSGDHNRWSDLASQAHTFRSTQMGGITGLQGQIKLLELEISRGRMGPADLANVFEKSKELSVRAYTLSCMLMVTDEEYRSMKKMASVPNIHPAPRFEQHMKLSQEYRLENTSLDDLLPILALSSRPLRSAAEMALNGAIVWLEEVNHTRWRTPEDDPLGASVRQSNLDRLRMELDEFRKSRSFAVLENFEDAFDDRGVLKTEMARVYVYSARGLFRCFVFATSLVYFVDVLIELLELLLEIEERNPKATFQLPTRFVRGLVRTANDRYGGGSPLDMGVQDIPETDTPDTDTDDGIINHQSEGKDADIRRRGKRGKVRTTTGRKGRIWPTLPDAGQPKYRAQRFGRRLAALWNGLVSAQGIFALKYALLTIGLWVPAICPSSAYFAYSNKVIWALIMAQTAMGVFTGEQIQGYFIRMGGTVLGLGIGIAAWYIGAGSGPGNPYGIAASTMVLGAPFMFLQLVAPVDNKALWLMIGVTIVFVIGYSWVDEHLYQIANQGSGAALAGKRALLVLIGFGAAFVAMLFPKPISAKRLVRRTLADNIGRIGNMYATILTDVEDEAALESGGKVRKLNMKERQTRNRAKFFKCIGVMTSLKETMTYAAFEPGLQGPWPKQTYHELLDVQAQILNSLVMLAGAFARLDPAWCKLLADRSDTMHPAFIADCLALFALLEHALDDGTPLPPTMPIFERLAYHRVGARERRRANDGHTNRVWHEVFPNDDESKDIMVEEESKALSQLGERLTRDTLKDEQFAIYATANVSLIHLTTGLNQMYRLIVSLVGEEELGAFDRAQERSGREDVDLV